VTKYGGYRKAISGSQSLKRIWSETTEIEWWIQENDTSRNDRSKFYVNCIQMKGQKIWTRLIKLYRDQLWAYVDIAIYF
jgi:hypothetical protein